MILGVASQFACTLDRNDAFHCKVLRGFDTPHTLLPRTRGQGSILGGRRGFGGSVPSPPFLDQEGVWTPPICLQIKARLVSHWQCAEDGAQPRADRVHVRHHRHRPRGRPRGRIAAHPRPRRPHQQPQQAPGLCAAPSFGGPEGRTGPKPPDPRINK